MSPDSTLTNVKHYSLWILGDLHVEFENDSKSMQSAFLVIQSDSKHEIHPVTCGYADIHLPVELSNWMHRSCPIHLCTSALCCEVGQMTADTPVT